MNSSQIASLVEISIPLLMGVLLLAKPSLFSKKNLDETNYLSVKKRLTKIGAGLLVVAGFLFIANADALFSSPQMSTEAFVAAVVVQSNQALPKRIDEVTTLERMSASGNTFLYHYRFQNLDLGGLSAEAASDILKPELIKQLRGIRGVEEFQARGIHVHHIYSAADGSVAFTIKIAPSEY